MRVGIYVYVYMHTSIECAQVGVVSCRMVINCCVDVSTMNRVFKINRMWVSSSHR